MFRAIFVRKQPQRERQKSSVGNLAPHGREEVLEIYNTFTWDHKGDEKKVNTIMTKFEAYCKRERHVFNTQNQQISETIDQYVTDLKTKAKTCEFGTLTDSLIRD